MIEDGDGGGVNVVFYAAGCWLVPRLYYIPESEFNDDLTTAGSVVTIRDYVYRFEPMIEEVPFQWAQALYLVTKLTSKCCQKFYQLCLESDGTLKGRLF